MLMLHFPKFVFLLSFLHHIKHLMTNFVKLSGLHINYSTNQLSLLVETEKKKKQVRATYQTQGLKDGSLNSDRRRN